MVQISDIRTTKKGRFSVYLDGEFDGVLHVDVLLRSRLAAGDHIEREHLEALYGETQYILAKERALRLLGGRAYTAKGLTDKLAERTDRPTARQAVERMIELGLVDDWDYARRFAADCVHLKSYSRRRTAQELMKKGIDKDIIEETLDNMEWDAQPAIAKIILRRYLRYLEDEKGQQKTLGALVRLGYGYSDIRCVMENLRDDPQYYDEIE